MYFVNPEIISTSKKDTTYEEGCLSVPGQFAKLIVQTVVQSNIWIILDNSKELKTDGLLATCIQHEMDHLEGILFIDYLSKLKRSMITKKL